MSRSKPSIRPATASPKHRIFLVDDHPVVLSGFKVLIESQPDLEVCGTAGSAEEGLGRAPASDADLIITDLTLPGRDGLEFIRDILAICPTQAVLVISMHDELLYAERALRAGSRGFLMKEAGSEKMLSAIRHVLAGNVYVSERMSAKLLDSFSGNRQRGGQSSIQKLSDREFEIFRMLGEGQSSKEIAARLHISGKTVAVHRGHIKEKLGLRTATELMHQAVRWVESGGARA